MSGLLVIPSRWGSTRLTGKPLRCIAGRTLLDRVVDIGRRAAEGLGASVVVATDDERIARHAEELDCQAILTPADLPSGSDRVLAAIDAMQASVGSVVNVQGDAPFMSVATVRSVLVAIDRLSFGCVTPVVELDWPALDALRARKRNSPFSGTTCVCGSDGHAIWFSKTILPAMRDEAALRRISARSPVRQHLGLYGYTLPALRRFCASQPTLHETVEGLEQLRLLELGIPVMTTVVEAPAIQMGGIDTAQDVALAERLIERHGDPYGQAI